MHATYVPSCIATEIRCTLFSDLFITSLKDIKVYKFYATCTNYYNNMVKSMKIKGIPKYKEFFTF